MRDSSKLSEKLIRKRAHISGMARHDARKIEAITQGDDWRRDLNDPILLRASKMMTTGTLRSTPAVKMALATLMKQPESRNKGLSWKNILDLVSIEHKNSENLDKLRGMLSKLKAIVQPATFMANALGEIPYDDMSG